MIIWCFLGQDGFRALSDNKNASCLPPQHAPWKKLGVVRLNDEGKDAVIQQRIKAVGCYLFEENEQLDTRA